MTRTDRPRGKRPTKEPRPSWEDGFGMELDSVVVQIQGDPVSPAMVAAHRAMVARRVDGRTPQATSRVHGTRMAVAGRTLVLLTLARPDGGYRLVLVDPLAHAQTQLYSAKVSAHTAGVRHYRAIAVMRDRWGAQVTGGDVETSTVEARAAHQGSPAAPDAAWESLGVRLANDAAQQGPIGDVARAALSMYMSGEPAQVVMELLAATKSPFAPIADRASQWLRLLGYDAVTALLPEGPDQHYASKVLHFDPAMP